MVNKYTNCASCKHLDRVKCPKSVLNKITGLYRTDNSKLEICEKFQKVRSVDLCLKKTL